MIEKDNQVGTTETGEIAFNLEAFDNLKKPTLS